MKIKLLSVIWFIFASVWVSTAFAGQGVSTERYAFDLMSIWSIRLFTIASFLTLFYYWHLSELGEDLMLFLIIITGLYILSAASSVVVFEGWLVLISALVPILISGLLYTKYRLLVRFMVFVGLCFVYYPVVMMMS